jgi:uncharacterized membrane protein YhaH (DUF805 family)
MTFVDAVKSGFKNYANFKGVASRSEFWYWVLFGFLLQLVTNTLDTLLGSGALSNLAQLALLLPGLAMAARRLRDSGRTPLWLLSIFAVFVSMGWLIVTFATEFYPLFGNYSPAELQAALDEFDQSQTGPIADALTSGAFNGSLIPILVTAAVGTIVGVLLLVFYCARTKTAAEGNKYASDAPVLDQYDGGTTA